MASAINAAHQAVDVTKQAAEVVQQVVFDVTSAAIQAAAQKAAQIPSAIQQMVQSVREANYAYDISANASSNAGIRTYQRDELDETNPNTYIRFLVDDVIPGEYHEVIRTQPI